MFIENTKSQPLFLEYVTLFVRNLTRFTGYVYYMFISVAGVLRERQVQTTCNRDTSI